MTSAKDIRDAMITEITRQFDEGGYFIRAADDPDFKMVDGHVNFDKLAEVVVKLVEDEIESIYADRAGEDL